MQYKVTSSLFLLASLLAQFVNGDAASLVTALGTLVTDAETTDTAVKAFTSADGISGALAVQNDSTQFSKDLDAAISAASGVTSADSAAVAAAYAKLGTPVTSLLNDLASKAGDFGAVGTTVIVQQDLTELQGKSNNLLAAIYQIISCDDASTVEGAADPINSAYVAANSAYDNANADPPAASCQAAGSSAPPSSAPTGSAPASSGPVSSAVVSTPPSSQATVPPNSAGINGTTTVPPTGNTTVTTIVTTETIVTDCTTSGGSVVPPYKTTSTVTKTIVSTIEDCGCTETKPAATETAKPTGAKTTSVKPAASTAVPPAESSAPVVNGANPAVVNGGLGLLAIGAAALLL